MINFITLPPLVPIVDELGNLIGLEPFPSGWNFQPVLSDTVVEEPASQP